MRSRKVRAWVVVNDLGEPVLETVATERSASADAYDRLTGRDAYNKDRVDYGVRTVRCTITTEVRGG